MNHETCLLPSISQRVHPEIVLLILITYWQGTQPERNKFSHWDVCVVGGRETKQRSTQILSTWNHQSSTLKHETSAAGLQSWQLWCLLPLCNANFVQDKVCRNICGMWRVKYEERIKVFASQMTTQTHTFWNALCGRTNIISCLPEAASLVRWPSFSSWVLLPLPG